MEKSFLEKRINQRANERLEDEYDEMRRYLYKSKMLGFIEIKEICIRENKVLPDFHNVKLSNKDESNTTNIAEVVEERRKELIQEETNEVMKKLDSIEYLFKQM